MFKKTKKRTFTATIIVGFLMLYLIIMLISTIMVKQKFMGEFELNCENTAVDLQVMIEAMEADSITENSYSSWRTQCEYILSMYLQPNTEMDSPYQQFSAAIYTQSGLLFAQSEARFLELNVSSIKPGFIVSEYLTDEEMDELAEYAQESLKNLMDEDNESAEYQFTTVLSEIGRELLGIRVQKAGVIVWEWQNPGLKEEISEISKEKADVSKEEADISVIGAFPYLYYGYDYWKQWMQSEYLHEFPQKLDVMWSLQEYNDKAQASYEEMKNSKFQPQYREQYSLGNEYLVLASECHPWLAAVDYMKYFYIGSFLLVLFCGTALVYMANYIWKQQEILEENRRDFTNAMAHEMKTPLGIIRGFAENIKENTVEEKKDYYLDQIIGQTEEMDRMTAEMIYISRLDSEKLVLQKEELSFRQLIQEQLLKFTPVLEEKQIQIVYEDRLYEGSPHGNSLHENSLYEHSLYKNRESGESRHESAAGCSKNDFLIEGDRKYLEKAIWNLLSNAICYNELIELRCDKSDEFCDKRTARVIWIYINSQQFSIENTASPIEEQQMNHIFEMFQNGKQEKRTQRNRNQEKHLGIGLYLTRKILKLHQLEITVQNTERGVKVTVSR